MKRHLVPLIQAILTSVVAYSSENCASQSAKRYLHQTSRVYSLTNRDVAFGALLPLHFKDQTERCQTPKHSEGLLWLSALNYAVDDVNRNWKWNLNASLFLKVRDTCSDGQIALEKALDFTNGYRNGANVKLTSQEKTVEFTPVLGVISASQNQDASTLLGLFKVPQIIFGKTKAVAGNSNEILRSVSIGFYKARALADLVKYFSWDAVSVVYSTLYQDDFETFLRISNIEHLCIAIKVQLAAGKAVNSSGLEKAVENLSSEPQSAVVILFTEEEETTALLNTIKQKTSIHRHFTWILANQQSLSRLHVNPEHDALMLVPQFPFMEGFRNHFKGKDPSRVLNSILYTTGLPNSYLNSAMIDSLSKQTKEEIQGSMNSVYLLAHAYETASRRTDVEQLDRATFSRSLGHVHDVFYSQNWKLYSGQRRMKENMFSLIHVRLNGPMNRPANVGTWDSSWYINHLGINWSSRAIPKSSCGEQCSPGYIRVVKDDCKCCWSCIPCHYNQIVTDAYTCTDCLRGYWPNIDYTKCEFQWHRTLFDCTLAVVAVVFVFSFMVL